MEKMVRSALCMAMVLALIISAAAEGAVGSCDVKIMAPCREAIMNKHPPTAACCSTIKPHLACVCGILKDPRYTKYKDDAKRVIRLCGLKSPSCLAAS